MKTHFDAVADQDKVVQTLRAGCAHMRQAFDIESINVDELISTALNDQKAVGTGIKAFHGINFADLNVAYHQFCKNENVGGSVVDLGQVIEFFNDAAGRSARPCAPEGPEAAEHDRDPRRQGREFCRRVRAEQPAHLGVARRYSRIGAEGLRGRRGQAVLPASWRRRARHHPRLHGQSRRIGAAAGRLDHHPAGGEEPAGRRGRDLRAQDPRDHRGVAGREHADQGGDSRALPQFRLPRPQLMGRRDGGAELFRQIGQGAHPRRGGHAGGSPQGTELLQSRPPAGTRERNGSPMCSAACRRTASSARSRGPRRWRRRRRSSPWTVSGATRGFHFVDFLGREAKADGVESLTAQPYTVHSTINATLQRDAEAALQEGLAHYEIEAGRVQFHGPEANIADAVQKLSAGNRQWRRAGRRRGRRAGGDAGLAAGARECSPSPLRRPLGAGGHPQERQARRRGAPRRSRRRPHPAADDIGRRHEAKPQRIRCRLRAGDRGQRRRRQGSDGRTRARATAAQAQLRVRPTVQGATLVLENKTGRILAMAGSFSYPPEPAQSHVADAASAGLGDQAADLSHGAAEGPAAEHPHSRRALHIAADRQPRNRLL